MERNQTPRICLLLAVIISAYASQISDAAALPKEKQKTIKDWQPDVSLKLNTGGKESAVGHAIREHKATANALYHQQRYDDAAREYEKCVRLQPDDFDCHFWRGMSLVRVKKFAEAIPSFEKAHEARPNDEAPRIELFACYLATQQFPKAVRILPIVVGVIGGVLAIIYLVGLAILLLFSLPIRARAFPGLRFSVAWLVLFLEGQIAFLLLLALLPAFPGPEIIFAALVVAGLPVIAVGATGFARQPWGEPFRWPLRLGGWKTVGISLFWIFLLFLMNAAFSALYVLLTHKPAPLQNTIPMIARALRANPIVAWLAIPFVVPIVEEILFRGLFYGALQKHWGIKAAIGGSAFLFACVHLQLVGFFSLFCLGLILGWARWRSGALGLPIAIHCLNNALLMLALTFASPV
jgi:membrane protease YdiL (CAAX protease family)